MWHLRLNWLPVRSKQRLGLSQTAADALKMLNAGALVGNLAIAKGRPILGVSKDEERHFLVHAASIAGNGSCERGESNSA
jgi:hypothetical protein